MQLIKKIFINYLYLIGFILMAIVYLLDFYWNFLKSFCESESGLSTLVNIDATLIGFLVTGATIFLTIIDKNTGYMKRVKKYKHDKIFMKTIFFGIIFFLISIFSWILNDLSDICNRLCVCFFVAGASEIIVEMVYLYNFIMYSENN